MFAARFQSFDEPAERGASGPRVAALRTEMAGRNLTGFIVPRADRHQNESVPACEERLAWLTGFTGSAGIAVVLLNRAVLFVDGRYTLQARQQVDALFELCEEELAELGTRSAPYGATLTREGNEVRVGQRSLA